MVTWELKGRICHFAKLMTRPFNSNVVCGFFIPLSPHDAQKHHFTSLKTHLIFPTTRGFRMKISMKLVIFFNFSPTLSHLHPLQVENCDSNSRLVVDEDDNGKLRLERVNLHTHVSVDVFSDK